VAPFVALGLAVVCLVLALTGFRFTRTATGGAAILTMDVSQSMNQQDVEPSRLDAAVTAARTFLDQLPEGLRVGLVTFADDAVVVVPPVEDRTQVSDALDGLARGKGTVIGDGLARALDEIERDRAEQGTDAAAVSCSPTVGTRAARRRLKPQPNVPPSLRCRSTRSCWDKRIQGRATRVPTSSCCSRSRPRPGQTFTAVSAGELDQIYETLGQQLSTDLAIDDSGAVFYVLAAVFAAMAAVLVLMSSRPSY